MRASPLFVYKKVEHEISPYAKSIVGLYAQGFTTEQIGVMVSKGKKTVERHIQDIRKEYAAKNIAHLVAIFLRNKIIP